MEPEQELPAPKKLRLLDSRNDADDLSFVPAIAMKAEIHQIPEVLEIIFSYLDEWSVRNYFRLVSRIWNLESCQMCKQLNQVHIEQELESSQQQERFLQLLQNNRSLNLTLPFSTVHLTISTWNSLILHELAKEPQIRSLHLKFLDTGEHNARSFHHMLNKLLADSKFQSKLKSLEIGCGRNFSKIFLKPTSLVLSSCFYFPELTQIVLSGGIGDDPTLDYLVHLINKSPNLCSFSIGPELQSEYLVKIFERANLDKVTSIEFDVSSAILPAREILPSVERIRATMGGGGDTLNEGFTVPRQLVREFANALKELEIFWNPVEINLNTVGFPPCSNLTKLTVYNWGGHIGLFNFQSLPALKEISLFQDIIGSDNIAFTSTHPGVEILRFNEGILYPNDLILPPHFNRFLSHVAIQFPNLNSMFLTWNISFGVMQVIIRKFPRLERLELISKFGFNEELFTGRLSSSGVLDFRNYWRNGFNWSLGDGCLTLADMKSLKHLRLEHGWNPTNNPDYDFHPLTSRGLQEGIAKIPSLQTLRITWTPNLSITSLQSLSHVRSIQVEINVDDNEHKPDTYKRLQLLWPQVKIIRKRHKFVKISWVSQILEFVKSLWSLGE